MWSCSFLPSIRSSICLLERCRCASPAQKGRQWAKTRIAQTVSRLQTGSRSSIEHTLPTCVGSTLASQDGTGYCIVLSQQPFQTVTGIYRRTCPWVFKSLFFLTKLHDILVFWFHAWTSAPLLVLGDREERIASCQQELSCAVDPMLVEPICKQWHDTGKIHLLSYV